MKLLKNHLKDENPQEPVDWRDENPQEPVDQMKLVSQTQQDGQSFG
jgi:hypothetical protein